MLIDDGVESIDSFWKTIKNRRGEDIVTPSGPFEIELRSPLSIEMITLRNATLDRTEVSKLKFRRELKRDGVLGDPDKFEDRLWDFMAGNLTETSFRTVVASVKAWRNFPPIVDPVTRKRLDPQPSAPDCNVENVENFLRENPDIYQQLKRVLDDTKNYLKERGQNSSPSSSVSSEASAS